MSGDLRPDPPNVLETTRIRGGASAKVGAIIFAGVLGLVVWIGISGRPTPVVPPSLGPELALVFSPIPSAILEPNGTLEPVMSPTPTPTPTPSPEATARAHAALGATDHYIVLAMIGNKPYMTTLQQSEDGHLSGVFDVPIPPPATSGTLQLDQVWRTVSHDASMKLATWDLRLESLSAASGREYIVLDRSVRARPTMRNVALAVNRGYRITVRAQSGIVRGRLSVDIRIGPNRQLVGDDGIFGWPVVAQLNQSATDGPGVRNDCFWTGRPPPSRRPPWPTYDETSCG